MPNDRAGNGDIHVLVLLSGVVVHFQFGVRQRVKDNVHIFQIGSALVVEVNVAALPIEELATDFLFQPGDGGAQRRRRNHEVIRGLGEMLAFGKLFEILQLCKTDQNDRPLIIAGLY